MIKYNKDNVELLYTPEKWSVGKAIKEIKKVAIAFAKRSELFRKRSRKVLLEERTTRFAKHTENITTDPKVILFSAFDGRNYSDSPRAIYEYMLEDERFSEYTFVWAFKEPKKFTHILDNKNTYIVVENTLSYEQICAQAKYWFFNFRVADHICPKDDQVYVQLWHGTPLKRLGFDIAVSDNAMNSKEEIRDKYRIDAIKFKYLLAPSAFAGGKFISAWNLKKIGKENVILEAGYPRNDFLINYTHEEVKRLRSNLKIPENKKIILYAPTWRDNQHNAKMGYVYTPEVDFDKLKENLGEEYVILFRAHYLVANSFNFKKHGGFVYDVSNESDINRLYVISDLLITDYSSVFFDYANLRRPMIFYMYDLDDYANEIRGFYITLDELPGPIVQTQDKLLDAIVNVFDREHVYADKYKAFCKEFNYLDDGQASKRVIEAVIEEIQDVFGGYIE